MKYTYFFLNLKGGRGVRVAIAMNTSEKVKESSV
jgi:hypothetical protein